MQQIVSIAALALLAACNSDGTAAPSQNVLPGSGTNTPAAGTRPAGQPTLITKEGLIEQGTECAVLRTPDGEVWSLSLNDADFGPGDYVSVTAEVADASFCQHGKGTLIPHRIDARIPPARS